MILILYQGTIDNPAKQLLFWNPIKRPIRHPLKWASHQKASYSWETHVNHEVCFDSGLSHVNLPWLRRREIHKRKKHLVSNIISSYNYPLKINNNHVKKQKAKHNTLCYWKVMFLPKIQESWKPIYQWRFPSKYIYDPSKQYWKSKL